MEGEVIFNSGVIFTFFTNRFKSIDASSLFIKSCYRKKLIAFTASFLAIFNKMFTKVIANVKSLSYNFKVFNSIIKPVSVYMVNYFLWKGFKLMTKMLLHYYTVFSNLFPIDSNKFVSVKNLTRPLRSPFGFKRVSIFRPSIIMFGAIESTINFIRTFINSTFIHQYKYTRRNQLCQGET